MPERIKCVDGRSLLVADLCRSRRRAIDLAPTSYALAPDSRRPRFTDPGTPTLDQLRVIHNNGHSDCTVTYPSGRVDPDRYSAGSIDPTACPSRRCNHAYRRVRLPSESLGRAAEGRRAR